MSNHITINIIIWFPKLSADNELKIASDLIKLHHQNLWIEFSWFKMNIINTI